MYMKMKEWPNIVEDDYIATKSILFIGSIENDTTINVLQRKFKTFDSSWNTGYILSKLSQYDVILFVSYNNQEDYDLLAKIRKKNDHKPIVIVNNTTKESSIEYIKYNISCYIPSDIASNDMLLVLQNLLKNHDSFIKNKNLETEQGEYLKILDDFVIISKTDLKGRITYVNDIFCEISGYNKEELIGSHHNIVRHPSMPQEAFKKMWQTIKENKIWTGVVKNKAKDDSVYIAKSTVMPYYENEEKIGYIGLRYVVTEEITEKSTLKSYLTKTIINSKQELKEKNQEIEKNKKELELLRNANDDTYYMAWQRELEKKQKLQKQINSIEEELKQKEDSYTKRIDSYLAERRENNDIVSKKIGEINVLNEKTNIQEKLLKDFKLDIEEKNTTIQALQKRTTELNDILTHKEEELSKHQ